MDGLNLAMLAFDPTVILQAQGMTPDAWQRDFLLSADRQILLNCCRQSGKSTTTSALALHTALFNPSSLVLLLSPTQRQSGEIFRKVMQSYNAVNRPIRPVYETQLKLELANGSRIVCLPGREETVRSFSDPKLIVLDEASRIPDELYYSVRPMLAVSKGRLIAMSTPFGKRGWFYHAFSDSEAFRRYSITHHDCPRISDEFVAEEERAMGKNWVDQEYRCLFTAMEGMVYPEFEDCIVDTIGVPQGRAVGGIDFGWRNPFAAIWGYYDRDDVLTIVGERYARETALHEHIAKLKTLKSMTWYADPAGATEINECRAAGMTVMKGNNDIRLGIAAVTARIRTGRLKVSRANCYNLISEAGLYRYPTANERAVLGENPIDADNHALAALRYLISRLDHHFIARLRQKPKDGPPELPEFAKADPEKTKEYQKTHGVKPWLRVDNPALWPDQRD